MALNDEQIGKIRMTMATAGWNDVVIPILQQKMNAALSALRLDPSERKAEKGIYADTEDATLRAVIRECEWITFVFRNEVSVFDANQRRDELDGVRT